MLNKTARIKVADNSGITRVTVIGAPYYNKGVKFHSVTIKDFVTVAIKKFNAEKLYSRSYTKGKHRATRRKLQKWKMREKKNYIELIGSLIFLAVIPSTKKPWRRKDGTFVNTKTNRCVILNELSSQRVKKFRSPTFKNLEHTLKLIPTKVNGPIAKEFRRKKKRKRLSNPLFKNLYVLAGKKKI